MLLLEWLLDLFADPLLKLWRKVFRKRRRK